MYSSDSIYCACATCQDTFGVGEAVGALLLSRSFHLQRASSHEQIMNNGKMRLPSVPCRDDKGHYVRVMRWGNVDLDVLVVTSDFNSCSLLNPDFIPCTGLIFKKRFMYLFESFTEAGK